MNWSTKNPHEVEHLLSSDLRNGLTSKIALLRLKEEGKNYLDRSLDVTLVSALKTLFFDVAHLPVLCAIVMSFSYKSFLFGALSLIVWGAFMALYTFFYWRAKRRIARAALASVPPVKVLRDGKETLVPPHLLVRGDVFFLNEGDTVPCDAYILEARALNVYEGNAFVGGGQAQKNEHPTDAGEKAYASMHNMLFATSEILSGGCKAICTATGRYTLAVLENRVSPLYGGTTPDFFRKIKKRITPLLYVLSTFCLAILIFGFVYGGTLVFDSFFAAAVCISSLLSACADGILTIGYGFSLDSLRRKKRARALLENPMCPDLLPQLDCLFVDTEMMFDTNALSVQSIHTAHRRYRTDELELMKSDGADSLLAYASALESCVLAEEQFENTNALGVSPTRSAMQRFFSENDLSTADELKTISFRPSTNGFYYDSALLSDAGGALVVSTGDAASILRSCATFQNGDKVETLSEELRSRLSDEISRLRSQGKQSVAYATVRTNEGRMDHSSFLHRNMTFLFFVAFQRRESGSLDRFFNRCAQRKLEPIIFHDGSVESARLLIGEHPLLRNARVCDGRLLPDPCPDYATLIDHYEVFAAFSGEQKYKLFRELIDRKFKVGILARSEADQVFFKDAHVVFLPSASSEFLLKTQNAKERTAQEKALLKNSDVLIDHDINAVSDAVDAMFLYRRNVRASFAYLTGMLALRALLCVGSVAVGFSPMSLIGLLMLSFLWDTLTVYHLLTGAFRKKAQPLEFIPDFRYALKRSVNFMLPMIVLAVSFAVAFPLLSHYLPKFGQGAMALSLWWTLTAVSLVFARLGFGIKFSNSAKTRVIPVLAFLSLAGALPLISTLFGVSFHWLSPVVTVSGTLLFTLALLISNARENKYKQ